MGNRKFDLSKEKLEIPIRTSSVGSGIHKPYAQEDRDVNLRVITL